MTIEQYSYSDDDFQAPPSLLEAAENTADQEATVSSLALKRFEDFCIGEGVDVDADSEADKRHLVTELLRGFVLKTVISEVQAGDAKLIPPASVDGQTVEFYRNNNLRTESPARLRQQQAFRKQHMDMALAQRHEYGEIFEANQVLRGATTAGKGLVVYAARDLLTIYGMTMKKHGLYGRTAVQRS